MAREPWDVRWRADAQRLAGARDAREIRRSLGLDESQRQAEDEFLLNGEDHTGEDTA